jgi:hypothetical protein
MAKRRLSESDKEEISDKIWDLMQGGRHNWEISEVMDNFYSEGNGMYGSDYWDYVEESIAELRELYNDSVDEEGAIYDSRW